MSYKYLYGLLACFFVVLGTLAVQGSSSTDPVVTFQGPAVVGVGEHFTVSWSNNADVVSLDSLGWNGPVDCAGPGLPTGVYACAKDKLGRESMAMCPPNPSADCSWGGKNGMYLFFRKAGYASIQVKATDKYGKKVYRTFAVQAINKPGPTVSINGPTQVFVGDQFTVAWSNTSGLVSLESLGWDGPVDCHGEGLPDSPPYTCKNTRMKAGGLPACPPEIGCSWGGHNGSYLYFREPGTASVTIKAVDSKGRSATASYTVTAVSRPLPTVDIKANGSNGPITIGYNSSATISWTSSNATSCSVSPTGWSGTSGSHSTGNLTAVKTYIITCTGQAGSVSDAVTVNVQSQLQNPTADIKANSADGTIVISHNSSATISWTSSNATSCSVSPTGWSGTSGSRSTGSLTQTTTYVLTCTGPGGSVSDAVTVQIAEQPHAPNADIKANGSDGSFSVPYGSSATISWTSSNATSCSVSPTGWSGLSGSRSTGNLFETKVYVLTCTGSGGSASDAVTVHVQPQMQQPSADIKANGSDSSITIGYNSSATISWTSTHTTSCYVSPTGWNGTSDTRSTGSLTSGTTYILTCTGSGGTSSDSVTVNVEVQQHPTVDIKANGSNGPITIGYNSSATISWTSSNATSCSVSPTGWSGTSGSQSTGNLTSSRTYSISCTGSGMYAYDSVTVNVEGPSQAVPSAETRPATDITRSSATLWGFLVPNSHSATAWFEYGTSYSFGSSSSRRSVDVSYPNSQTSFSQNISGLEANTLYYFRLVVQNSYGTSYGNTLTFRTQAQQVVVAPIVVTLLPDSITQTSTRLNGLALPGGNIATTGWFEWGTSQSLGQETTRRAIGSQPSMYYSEILSFLAPNTLYYFRAVIQNQNGTVRGDIISFRTAGYVPPTVTKPPSPAPPVSGGEGQRGLSVKKEISGVCAVECSVHLTEATVLGGTQVEYSITIKNTGSATLRNIRIEDEVSPFTEFSSATEGGSYQKDQNKVVWTFPSFVRGQTKTVKFSVVAKKFRDSVVAYNTARVSADGVSRESERIQLKINSSDSPVVLSISSSPNEAPRGGEVAYTISIKNGMNDSIHDAELRIVLPAGLSFKSSDYAGALEQNNMLIYRGQIIAPGEDRRITVQASVDRNAKVGDMLATTGTFTYAGPGSEQEVVSANSLLEVTAGEGGTGAADFFSGFRFWPTSSQGWIIASILLLLILGLVIYLFEVFKGRRGRGDTTHMP